MSTASSSNKVLITVIILLILLIIGGAGGALWYLNQKDSASISQENSATLQKEKMQEIDSIGPLYPLAPITVNLKNANGEDVYLKITLSLELSSKLLANELDAKNAVIRDNIILILSNRSVDDIASDLGKEEICDEIKSKLNTMLDDGTIKHVYIVNFLIQ